MQRKFFIHLTIIPLFFAATCDPPCGYGTFCTTNLWGASQCTPHDILSISKPCFLTCPRGQQCELGPKGQPYCAPIKCGTNEELSDCGSLCEGKCENLGKDVLCPFICLPPACACRNGTYRNEETNKCVLPKMCTDTDADPPADEVACTLDCQVGYHCCVEGGKPTCKPNESSASP